VSLPSAPRLFSEVPRCALAVFAHPDDADVSAGGTLGAWAAAGAEVHLVVVTQGEKGSSDPSDDPLAVAAIRAGEVSRAAEALGLASVELLGVPDGEAPEATGLLEDLVRRIRALRPEVCLGHDPTSVLFGSVYVSHRDHRAAGWALLDAVAPAASMPHYFPQAGPAHRVNHLLLSGTLQPDAFVDIGGALEAKIAAVSCHRSQLGADPSWVAESVRARASDDGTAVGVAFAEGFRHLALDA
jgi:LmbE family N-acetylglucosaminyl deacetylase